jgi:hypothetical protein
MVLLFPWFSYGKGQVPTTLCFNRDNGTCGECVMHGIAFATCGECVMHGIAFAMVFLW